MSDEKRPFAEVRYNKENYEHEVVVAGEVVDRDGDGDGWEDATGNAMLVDRRRWCANINAAVEQREARLLGDIERLRDALHDVVDKHYSGKCLVKDEPCHDPKCCSEGRFRAVLAAVDQSSGYVPAAELAAEKETVRKLQAAVDLLSEPTVGGTDRHLTERVVREYLESNGLKKPEPSRDVLVLAIPGSRGGITSLRVDFEDADPQRHDFEGSTRIMGDVEVVVRRRGERQGMWKIVAMAAGVGTLRRFIFENENGQRVQIDSVSEAEALAELRDRLKYTAQIA